MSALPTLDDINDIVCVDGDQPSAGNANGKKNKARDLISGSDARSAGHHPECRSIRKAQKNHKNASRETLLFHGTSSRRKKRES
jgi:hypothetical protein